MPAIVKARTRRYSVVITAIIATLLALLSAGLAERLEARDFRRGDCNQDETLDISDPQFVLNFLFLGGGAPTCPVACDGNDDEAIDVSDPQYVLNFLFLGGPPPPAPFPAPGRDPTAGPLRCGDVDPPQALACRADGPAVALSWQGDAYDEVEISRDGQVVALLPGDAVSHVDRPCRGGTLVYEVRGRDGPAFTDAATCTVRGVPDNRPPAVTILSPAAGTLLTTGSVEVRMRVDDERAIQRVVIGGLDVRVPPGSTLPLTTAAFVDLLPGPNLIRVEAVDDFGRATFAELPVARGPVIRRGAFANGLTFDITAGPGYNEVEGILRPLLAQVSGDLSDAVTGMRFSFDAVVADVDVTLTSATASTPTLDLLAVAGAVGLRSTIATVTVNGDVRADFPFPLPDDNGTVRGTGTGVTATANLSFSPDAARTGIDVTVMDLSVSINNIDASVSGLVLGGLVNLLLPLFEDTIRSQFETALAGAINSGLAPVIAEALSDLRIPEIDLGAVSASTRFADILESTRGLTMLLDTAWSADTVAPGFPEYPGSLARLAPFPTSFQPTPDATICISVDSLNQALLELVSTGALSAELDLSGVDSPIDLTVLAMAAFLGDGRLSCIPGVSARDPVTLRVAPRVPPTVRLSPVRGGGASAGLLPRGASWRHAGGGSAAPGWTDADFDDSAWPEGASGFGAGDGLPSSVETRIDRAPTAASPLLLRGTFDVADPERLDAPTLRVETDGGFVAWLSGAEIARRDAGGAGDPPRHAEVDLAATGGLLAGRNVIAIEASSAAGSDSFVIVPEVFEQSPLFAVAAGDGGGAGGPAGGLDGVLEVRELVVSFVAANTELFALGLGFDMAVELGLGDDGLTVSFDIEDGPDQDTLPDAIIGGIAGLDIGVASESFDIDDDKLVFLAQVLLTVLGPELGGLLGSFELPTLPLPTLEFDLGGAPTTLGIAGATLVALDTNGGSPDWLCILADLLRR